MKLLTVQFPSVVRVVKSMIDFKYIPSYSFQGYEWGIRVASKSIIILNVTSSVRPGNETRLLCLDNLNLWWATYVINCLKTSSTTHHVL
jgi:hypothetical protein